MKIGIITYSYSNDNYGQQLQCWALQTIIKSLVHSPRLIRYKNISIDQLYSIQYCKPMIQFLFINKHKYTNGYQ